MYPYGIKKKKNNVIHTKENKLGTIIDFIQ